MIESVDWDDQLEKDSYDYWSTRGRVMANRGRYADALQCYDKALDRIGPAYDETYILDNKELMRNYIAEEYAERQRVMQKPLVYFQSLPNNEVLDNLLLVAQSIINKDHSNQENFFRTCKFEINFSQRTNDAFGYVDGTYPNYIIGIHELFKDLNPEDKRFVTMTMVHELLHIIHHDWAEEYVQREEYRLANLAGYFDTLQRRDGAYLERRKNLRDISS